MTRRDTALKYIREQTGEVRQRIEKGIEENRKRDAAIRLVSDGPLPEDVTVRAVQKSHEERPETILSNGKY